MTTEVVVSMIGFQVKLLYMLTTLIMYFFIKYFFLSPNVIHVDFMSFSNFTLFSKRKSSL